MSFRWASSFKISIRWVSLLVAIRIEAPNLWSSDSTRKCFLEESSRNASLDTDNTNSPISLAVYARFGSFKDKQKDPYPHRAHKMKIAIKEQAIRLWEKADHQRRLILAYWVHTTIHNQNVSHVGKVESRPCPVMHSRALIAFGNISLAAFLQSMRVFR